MKKHIIFIIIFAMITKVMNFCLVASNWASVDRWEEYSNGDDYDTLFVGSSVGGVIVPKTINGLNNCNCVNMSTPDQYYKTSMEAIRFISCRQPLKTVVLLTEFDGLECPEDYASAASFLDAQYETAPPLTREAAIIKDKLERYMDPDFLRSPDSINIWFDWVERFTYSIPQMFKNISYRMGRKDPGYRLDMRKTFDRIEPVMGDRASISEDYEKAQEMNLSELSVNEESLETLHEMAAYLKANDIRFVVMVTPHRTDEQAMYADEYDDIDSYFREFVTKRGGEYFNIDTDPELRAQLPDNLFQDSEHVDDKAYDLVSVKIAELLR